MCRVTIYAKHTTLIPTVVIVLAELADEQWDGAHSHTTIAVAFF